MGVSNFLPTSQELKNLYLLGTKVCTMSDEEYYEEEEVTSQTSKKGEGFLKAKTEGWTRRTVEGIHQRMAQTTWQRGGRIEEAQEKTSQAQGDQSRAREKIGPTKEGRGGEAPQGRGRKEGQGSKKEETSYDASSKRKTTSCRRQGWWSQNARPR